MLSRRAWQWFLAMLLIKAAWLAVLAWLAFRHDS
jgi:hypothetical protein